MGRLIFGLFLGLTIAACSGVPKFPYRHYSLGAESFHGALLGPKPEDDRDLRECTPTEEDKAPCQVVFTKDLMRLKMDYRKIKARLIDLERKCD